MGLKLQFDEQFIDGVFGVPVPTNKHWRTL